MRNHVRMIAAGAVCVGAAAGLLRSGGAEAALAALPPADTVPRLPAPTAPVPEPVARPIPLQAARAVLDGLGVESGVARSRTDAALRALTPAVPAQSDPDALRMAFRAYYNYQATHPERVRKPYLYFVDFGLDAHTPRGYVFDMRELRVVDGPFTVSHGRGSAPTPAGIPTRFSNRNGSHATSLGLYLTQETYNFNGRSGGRAYRSVGLRLAGVSGSYNSAARSRGIVVHGAPYVTALRAGRSEGCPALEEHRARALLPRIANGSMVFHFSPRDREWMRNDPWIHRG